MSKFKIAGLITIVGFLLVFAGTASADTFTWAQDVIWSGDEDVSEQRSNTENALGAPDAEAIGGVNFLSLGIGGYAIFDFGTEFNQAAVVFETTYGSTANYVENVVVYAIDDTYTWEDPINFDAWTRIGDYTNANEKIEIDVSGTYRYLLLRDNTRNSTYDGFDVNAVGVNPVPEPGTIILMGAGLIGLVGLRRKFRRQ